MNNFGRNLLQLCGACLLPVLLYSCGSSQKMLETLPDDTYRMTAGNYQKLVGRSVAGVPRKLKADLEWQDTVLKVMPKHAGLPAENVQIKNIKNIKLSRRTFGLGVLTIPFKVRPSVKGFPNQFNADFSVAVYMGRGVDFYSVKNLAKHRPGHSQIGMAGFGYGGFLGLGKVVINPYVTQQQINYNYDGMAISPGAALTYELKRFNFGLAIGVDYIADENSDVWIYQGRPWFGVLFGLKLN